MELKLQKLQKTNSKAQELRSKNGYQDINKMLHHQDLLFVPKTIWIEFINRHHNDS